VQVAAAPRLSRRHTVLVLLALSFEEGVGALVTRGAAAVAAMQEGPRSGRSSPGETDGGGGDWVMEEMERLRVGAEATVYATNSPRTLARLFHTAQVKPTKTTDP
jgi:hypothetical protein